MKICQGEVLARLGIVGPGRERLAEAFSGRAWIAAFPLDRAQIVQEVRVSGVGAHRLRDKGEPLVFATRLVQQQAQEMRRPCVARFRGKHLTVKRFGVLRLA